MEKGKSDLGKKGRKKRREGRKEAIKKRMSGCDHKMEPSVVAI